MQTLIKIIIVCLICLPLSAQEQNIKTQSVAIDDLISFVVENFEPEDTETRNITFLIQTNSKKLEAENKILLRQALKIISERLNEQSKLSLVTYSKFNGVALNPTPAKEVKLILHTLNDLKGNISEFHDDGIQLAYNHAEQNYMENAVNTVIMIRIKSKSENEVVNVKDEKKKTKTKKKDVLLAAALGLLPELLSVIKD